MARLNGFGYNGELHEAHAPWQMLGNGYRVYSAHLRRFYGPDNMSPFGAGGINAYTYCGGDPVNNADRNGHFYMAISGLLGMGAVAMLATAAASGIAGDRKAAGLFAAIGGALVLAAFAGAGVHRFDMRYSPLKPGAVRIIKGRRRDIVDVHGSANRSDVSGNALDGTQMAELLQAKGIGKKPVTFLSCGSADGPAPQAQVLADFFDRPFTGFRGDVVVNDFRRKPIGIYEAVVFHPQPGPARLSTAIRNTALNRQSQTHRAQRRPRAGRR